MINKVQAAKDSGLVLTLVVTLFNAYVTNEQGADEVEEAQQAARIETNIMNTMNNQADEDVNLQNGINRNEIELKELKEKFNDFVLDYYKNGGNDYLTRWGE